ncbi:MAG: Grx4 family monothiol glutaredoxin [Methanobacteriota archaeon]|nr:MAG: Grx4 family monothiol glutaredoxin [Euryarchaeota archaeon]|tara:strand:- start:691 stop:1017 length:327 start_codon:yes stop_codon:yes gene_type:complete
MEVWSNEWLDNIVREHDLVLFMKGTPDQPQCGFSNRAAQVLNQFQVPYAAINVLADRKAIPSICEWADFPTMPQIYVHGELIGGSDIVLQMYESGELKEMYDAGRQEA